MEMVIDKGDRLMQKFRDFLVPYQYGTMELLPDAPQEAIEARDEYLKWREEYQRTRSTFGDY
ncbi:TPA: hypothetical protein U2B98_002132 [Streptococcus suis]|nr:hypothetical protein [Streptococcus suis]HEM6089412.1 hypothetical protein [Streptococcus suis]HEM6113145.1 hypothetical protein [Streptococcus suis]HEM6221304.1 hypothetical protein [Streptococcus suis]HEM6266486.1 hypothetical protein [Streptococcus suis]